MQGSIACLNVLTNYELFLVSSWLLLHQFFSTCTYWTYLVQYLLGKVPWKQLKYYCSHFADVSTQDAINDWIALGLSVG